MLKNKSSLHCVGITLPIREFIHHWLLLVEEHTKNRSEGLMWKKKFPAYSQIASPFTALYKQVSF